MKKRGLEKLKGVFVGHTVGVITYLCVKSIKRNGPSHEIMVLFVLHKLILQMRSQMSDFWSDPSSASILHVCKQRRLW